MCETCKIGNLFNNKMKKTTTNNGLMGSGMGAIGATGIVLGTEGVINKFMPDSPSLQMIKDVAPVAIGVVLPMVLPKSISAKPVVKTALQGAITIGLYNLSKTHILPLIAPEVKGVGNYYYNTASVGNNEPAATEATG